MSKVMTQFALQANTIAETLRAQFAKTQLGDCKVEMSAPEESTRGGHFGLQQVMLRNPSGMAIVAASVHVGERKAELRTYATVSRLHMERFKRPPTFTETDYAGFLAKANPLLAAFNLQVTTMADEAVPIASPTGPTEDSAPAGSNQLFRLIAFIVAVILFGGAALFAAKQMLGH